MNSLDIIQKNNADAVAAARKAAPITLRLVLDVLEEIVAERPDYIYPKNDPDWRNDEGACVYRLPSGEPACIVGVLLYRLGLPLPEFESTCPARVLFPDTLSNAELDGRRVDLSGLDPRYISIFLSAVQLNQDEGMNWRASVEDAKTISSYKTILEAIS